MIETLDFSQLGKRFKEIRKLYLSNKLKYIHSNSVENFIIFGNNLSSRNQKEVVLRTLNEYFEIISNKKVDNPVDSAELFKKFILPIASLYVSNCNFKIIYHLRTILFWLMPLLVILYFLSFNIGVYVGLFTIIFIVISRQLYFTTKRKAYGFMF